MAKGLEQERGWRAQETEKKPELLAGPKTKEVLEERKAEEVEEIQMMWDL